MLDVRVAQAMMSGCLVAAAPPDVEHKELAGLILPLRRTEEAVPVEQVQAALANLSDADIKGMLLSANIYARQVLADEARVLSVVELLGKFEAGARGYMVSLPTRNA